VAKAGMYCEYHTNHYRTPLWLNSQELARHDAAASRLAECLLMHLLKLVSLDIELEDGDLPAIGSDHKIVCGNMLPNYTRVGSHHH
jgi:hypothetical protein